MKNRGWLASTAIIGACLISLSAAYSASVQFAAAPEGLNDQYIGKGKGRCKRDVFCVPSRCEQMVCTGNSCNCECVPIPNCEPIP